MRWVVFRVAGFVVAALLAVPSARADERVATAYGPALAVAPMAQPLCGVSPCFVPARRGPIEVREEFVLAAPRLTLPATSPDPLCCGEVRIRIAANRGSDFAFNEVSSERTVVRKWLVDDEHQTTEMGVRWGIRPDLDVGFRLPVQWRGGGFMDEIIDDFHDFFGLPDNDRPAFSRDAYQVQLRTEDGTLADWSDRGVGLGNVELEAHWAFLRRRHEADWSAALVGRVGLPTGTGPSETGSVDLGLQVVVAKQIAHRLDAYAGLGATFFSETEDDGLEYEPFRLHGFLSGEWRVGSRWSLYAEISGATRLVTNVPSYPWAQFNVSAGLKFQLARRWILEVGFTEGLVHQQATVDFGAFAGLTVSL